MKTYPERYDALTTQEKVEFRACRKRPIPVKAVQINQPFRVNSLEGNYKQGKPGDYLICGIANELYICDKEIFERSYDWVTAGDSK